MCSSLTRYAIPAIAQQHCTSVLRHLLQALHAVLCTKQDLCVLPFPC
jgi:hypothetical protein